MSNSSPLWAPWRMDYILGEKTDGCFLCEIFSATADHDRKNLLLYRGDTCAVVMNRYPYNNGHLMIAPYRHINRLDLLTDAEKLELSTFTSKAVAILEQQMNAEGFNIGINLGSVAGAGLKDHLHQHIVPRWNGDTNFMPVLADTKVMPQHLEATYDQLAQHFRSASL